MAGGIINTDGPVCLMVFQAWSASRHYSSSLCFYRNIINAPAEKWSPVTFDHSEYIGINSFIQAQGVFIWKPKLKANYEKNNLDQDNFYLSFLLAATLVICW